MKYLGIAAVLLLAAALGAPAEAQVARGIEGDAAQSQRAKFCEGSVRGHRWYLTTSSPVTMGVIDVRKNGRVKRQTARDLRAQSEAFGSRAILGGRLFDNDPVFKKGAPNRCFVSGRIKIAGDHAVEIFNAFIPRGKGLIAGRCVVDGFHQTACALSRY